MLGLRPSASVMTPAFTSFSLNLPISANMRVICSSLGRMPFSLLGVALTKTRTFMRQLLESLCSKDSRTGLRIFDSQRWCPWRSHSQAFGCGRHNGAFSRAPSRMDPHANSYAAPGHEESRHDTHRRQEKLRVITPMHVRQPVLHPDDERHRPQEPEGCHPRLFADLVRPDERPRGLPMQMPRPDDEQHETHYRTQPMQQVVDGRPAEARGGAQQSGKRVGREGSAMREGVPDNVRGGAENDGHGGARDQSPGERIRMRESRVPA